MTLTKTPLALCILTALFAMPLMAQSKIGGLTPKQLAGSPDEFALMQPANPLDSAVSSKSALIPVRLTERSDGSLSWSAPLPMDAKNARLMLLRPAQSAWNLNLVGAAERTQARAVVNTATEFGMQGAKVPAQLYAFENLVQGDYDVTVYAPAGSATQGFLLLEGDPSTRLVSYQTASNQRVGAPVTLNAQLKQEVGLQTDGAESMTMVTLSDEFYREAKISKATLVVTAPGGEQSEAAFYDDGLHNDGAADDGLFGAQFVPTVAGNYNAQVRVHGLNGKDQALMRTAEHLIPVLAPQLELSKTPAAMRDMPSAGTQRVQIQVALTTPKNSQAEATPKHYRAYAQVWGSARGKDVPVAWVSAMVTPEQGLATLELDSRWIALAGAQAPYSLRQVRFEDPDTFVTVAQADRVAVTDTSTSVAADKSVQVDEAMRMGVRPTEVASSIKGVGQRLLLVHGYCSGAVWPAANFSSASTFLDASQNRSNDQFAQLIAGFGNTWNSYGIVAHSQGGMASLHLYNYYWSGLDNATGARLIQSVGTPYKGTNLAGVLAAIGSLFGVGCGFNNDLTYTGAANWLAGIANTNRAKVHYHTTSFKLTNWWTNDYCNFASDLVLGDPEDGTTEQANGQLLGGNNRGHVTGQCHTDGMRDPAQYRDATRNANMNSNAAR
jgi:hypothetical protein